MPYEIDDPDFPVYESAEDRLSAFGLHPSHSWVRFAQGDCFDGIHADMSCARCDIRPLPGYWCYHELPYTPEEAPKILRARGEAVNSDALQPCPGTVS